MTLDLRSICPGCLVSLYFIEQVIVKFCTDAVLYVSNATHICFKGVGLL